MLYRLYCVFRKYWYRYLLHRMKFKYFGMNVKVRGNFRWGHTYNLELHDNVVIGENTDDEEHIVIDNYSDLEEAARIWYYEELLPLGLANPDLVQSDKAYFKYEFPELAEMYLTDYDQIPDLDNGEVIMMQPDFNIDAEMENTIVMLLGENEIND